MEYDSGTVSGTGQISSLSKGITSIEFHARSKNEGSVIVGRSDRNLDNGREIPPDGVHAINFGNGSVLFSVFYVTFEMAGDLLDWTVLFD